MQEGTEAGAVVVAGIYLEEGALVLDIQAGDPTLQATLETFQDALTGVIENPELLTDLGGVLDTTDGGTEQAVYEAVVDLQATLTDPEGTVEPEQIEELFTNFDELDEETQAEFLDTITELIDPSVYEDFSDLFGGLDQEEETTE